MSGRILRQIREDAAADRSGTNPFENDHPLRFTPKQRKALSDRVLLQKPPGEAQAEEFRALLARRKTIEGIPTDVLFTLEAIRQLAEQGNEVAKTLYWLERERLGIDIPRNRALGGR